MLYYCCTMITFKFVLRTKGKSGLRSVALRITSKRQTVFYFPGIKVTPGEWNAKKQMIRGNDRRNLIIGSLKKRMEDIRIKDELDGLNLSAAAIKNLLYNYVSDSFNDFCRAELEKMTLKYGTRKAYKSQITKLSDFRPKIDFRDINFDFLEAYKLWLIETRENNTATANKALSVLRTFVKRAKTKGLIKHNPFDGFQIGSQVGNRDFLTIEELKYLRELLTSDLLDEAQKRVLQYFLFACYTGLRFGDLNTLRHSNIENDMIVISMHKTELRVSIPLSETAKALIPPARHPKDYVFRTFTNQATNRKLKEIMQIAGIKKPVSFHVARHTFATVAITLGIPVEVVSKLLGHTTIKQTMIYAKIVDHVKIKEMKKFDMI